jgi:lysophospholipase L1-like esterase
MESICVFGDSTAWGAWDVEKGGWVARLWFYAARKAREDCWVYNLSVSGGTTETILERFESEAKVREADALIFQTGGNDSALIGDGGPNQVAPEKFRANLEEIIRRAKKLTDNIMFVGFKNVDEARTTPVSWVNVYYLNSELKKYNGIMETVCKENGVLFLDVFGILNNDDLEDGVHPNARGHEKIFEKVRAFLEANKWI